LDRFTGSRSKPRAPRKPKGKAAPAAKAGPSIWKKTPGGKVLGDEFFERYEAVMPHGTFTLEPITGQTGNPCYEFALDGTTLHVHVFAYEHGVEMADFLLDCEEAVQRHLDRR
jgi:hypothetical protein